MSILQEYIEIRRRLGEKEFALINKFLDTHKDILLSDIYYKQEIWKQYEDWKKKNKKKPYYPLYENKSRK